jgi:hypothetical protein
MGILLAPSRRHLLELMAAQDAAESRASMGTRSTPKKASFKVADGYKFIIRAFGFVFQNSTACSGCHIKKKTETPDCLRHKDFQSRRPNRN